LLRKLSRTDYSEASQLNCYAMHTSSRRWGINSLTSDYSNK
jgi:hypothetical protein